VADEEAVLIVTNKKSPHLPKQHTDFSYLKSHFAYSLSLYHGELLSAEIMAGLLARDSSSRRLPGLTTSDIMPFVLAYSGGSAGEWSRFHIKALSSLARLRLLNVRHVRLVASILAALISSLIWNRDCTPLPYQALAGTVIRYSIVIQHAKRVVGIPRQIPPVKEDCS
jgi:hypothetical protein